MKTTEELRALRGPLLDRFRTKVLTCKTSELLLLLSQPGEMRFTHAGHVEAAMLALEEEIDRRIPVRDAAPAVRAHYALFIRTAVEKNFSENVWTDTGIRGATIAEARAKWMERTEYERSWQETDYRLVPEGE